MKLRHQGDDQQEAVSKASRKDCSIPVLVRPEFGPETDVKTILARHGAIPAPNRTPTFTQTDYDLDLTRALGKIRRAHDAFDELPREKRQKFRSADELWRAYLNDELERPGQSAPAPGPAPTAGAPLATAAADVKSDA